MGFTVSSRSGLVPVDSPPIRTRGEAAPGLEGPAKGVDGIKSALRSNLRDGERGAVQKAAGLLDAQFAEMVPEASARQHPELRAKVAFGIPEGQRQLREAEPLIQPGLDVAVDPGNDVRLGVRADHAGNRAHAGAETSQQKPEMVRKQAAPVLAEPAMDQFPQQDPLGRTDGEGRARTQWLDLLKRQNFKRDENPADPLPDAGVGMELKRTNELRLSFVDIEGVRIDANLPGPPHRNQKRAPVVVIGANRTRRGLPQVRDPQQLGDGMPGKTEDFSGQNPRYVADALGTTHLVGDLRGNPADFQHVGIRLRNRFFRRLHRKW